MESVIIVYKTDAWHSYASRDILGVVTCIAEAIAICNLQAQKEGEIISADEMFNLENIEQTQGYEGEGEFYIEEIQTNVLL